MLGLTAVPDIEDMTEALDGTLDKPSPELLAELLGASMDLVTGAVWDEWSPTLECLAGALGVSVEKGCKLFDWHNRAAARSAERIKTRAIIRIAGFFSIERIRGRQALGFCFCGGLSLQYGRGSIQDYAASIEVSRVSICKSLKFKVERDLTQIKHGP